MCESCGMAQTVNVIVPAEDRERLLAIIGDRNRPLKHVQRAKIILSSAERLPVVEAYPSGQDRLVLNEACVDSAQLKRPYERG